MKLTLSNIKTFLIIGLILYIILLQQCGGNSVKCPEVIATTKIDTLKIKGKTDTIEFIVEKPIYINIEVPIPVTISDPLNSSITLNEYKTSIIDSLLEGTITSQIDGILVSQYFEYKPLFPKYINRVDTIIIDKKETIIKKRWGISAGGEVGFGATSFNLSPVVSLHMKNDYIYSYRYGLIDKTHNVTIQKRLNFRRKSH